MSGKDRRFVAMRIFLRQDPTIVRIATSLIRRGVSVSCPNLSTDSPGTSGDVFESPGHAGGFLGLTTMIHLVEGLVKELWSAAYVEGTDGSLPGWTPETLDLHVGMPGFAHLLAEEPGWLEIRPDSLFVPAFNSILAPEEKRKRKDRERKREERCKTSKDNPQTSEDRLGQDPDGPPLNQNPNQNLDLEFTPPPEAPAEPPPPQGGTSSKRPKVRRTRRWSDRFAGCEVPTALDTADFRGAWSEWLEYRAERKLASWTASTVRKSLADLADAGHDEAIEAIGRSIASGWLGLFPRPQTNGQALGGGPRPAGMSDEQFAAEMSRSLVNDPDRKAGQEPGWTNVDIAELRGRSLPGGRS